MKMQQAKFDGLSWWLEAVERMALEKEIERIYIFWNKLIRWTEHTWIYVWMHKFAENGSV